MDAEAIQEIEKLTKQSCAVEIDGQAFSELDLRPVVYTPKVSPLKVHSLLGFCTYVNSIFNFDGFETDRVMAIVDNEAQVRLVSAVFGKDKVRETHIAASLENVDVFSFGKFMTQEEFAIEFRSLFVPSTKNDTEYVLRYASKLSGGSAIEVEDDGITQIAGVKRGVSGNLVAKEHVKPIVRLAPYRTFREIEQPESEFLFRSRIGDDDVPKLALFEADGGAWRIAAMRNIAAYIAAACDGLIVIA